MQSLRRGRGPCRRGRAWTKAFGRNHRRIGAFERDVLLAQGLREAWRAEHGEATAHEMAEGFRKLVERG